MILISEKFPLVTEPLNVPWTVPPYPCMPVGARMSRCATKAVLLRRVTTLVTPQGQLPRCGLWLQGAAVAPTFSRAAGVTRLFATLQTVPPTQIVMIPLLWVVVRTDLVALTVDRLLLFRQAKIRPLGRSCPMVAVMVSVCLRVVLT